MSDIYKYFNTPMSKICNMKFLINKPHFPNITDSKTISKDNFIHYLTCNFVQIHLHSS